LIIKNLYEREKKLLFEFGCKYSNDAGLLYDINKAIVNKNNYFKSADGNVIFKIKDDLVKLKFRDGFLELETIDFRKILIGMIDILEKIYLLGTVVELKKSYLRKNIQVDKIKKILIVITNRFLHSVTEKLYFPYAGVAYPIGTFDRNEVIHFTSPLIENIIHMGYSDVQDDAYNFSNEQKKSVMKK